MSEELPPTARTIGITDVDRGVKRWFEKVVAATVQTPDGEFQAVTVKFASGERWVASADRQGIRDRDGRLILPIIQVSRLGFDPVSNMTAVGANVPTMQISRKISEKTSALATLDYSRLISERRLRDSAVYDVYTIPFPVNGVINYKVKVQAQYIHQLNTIQEKLLSKLEFFDVPSFVISLAADEQQVGIPVGNGDTELIPEDHAPYDLRKPLSDYYVVGYLDGDFGDGGNLEEFTDQERIVQLSLSFRVPVALMLDPSGELPAVQKETTAFGVTMGDEAVHAVSSEVMDKIFGPR